MADTPPEAYTTVKVAEMVNAALKCRVYSDKDIRAEIAAGALIAQRKSAGRGRIRVTPEEFVRWAKRVLRDEQMARLRGQMEQAS